jgi:hypothetical protein
MNVVDQPRSIGVFYSRGPHYARGLRFLRGRYPEAAIAAITPPGYPPEALAGIPDRHVETGRSVYPAGDVSGLAALLRMLRGGRYDMFVVLFPSVKLRMLAALSGARVTYCYGPDGRFLPLRFSPFRLLKEWLARRVLGYVTYTRIWFIVHFQHVRMPGDK